MVKIVFKNFYIKSYICENENPYSKTWKKTIRKGKYSYYEVGKERHL
jgi:hypothetical protein